MVGVIVEHMGFIGNIGGDYLQAAFSEIGYLRYDKVHPTAVIGIDKGDIIYPSTLPDGWYTMKYDWIDSPPKLCSKWYHKIFFKHRNFFFEYEYNGKCFVVKRYHKFIKPYLFQVFDAMSYQEDTLNAKSNYPYFKNKNYFGPVLDYEKGIKIFVKENTPKTPFKSVYRHIIVVLDEQDHLLSTISTLFDDKGIYAIIERDNGRFKQLLVPYSELSSIQNTIIKGLTVIDIGHRKVYDLYRGILGRYNPETKSFEAEEFEVPEYF